MYAADNFDGAKPNPADADYGAASVGRRLMATLQLRQLLLQHMLLRHLLLRHLLLRCLLVPHLLQRHALASVDATLGSAWEVAASGIAREARGQRGSCLPAC